MKGSMWCGTTVSQGTTNSMDYERMSATVIDSFVRVAIMT